MNEETPEKTNKPRPDAKIEHRGYGIKITFHPELRLERKAGHEFAAALSDYLSIDGDELQSHRWEFNEPLPGANESRLLIVVSPNTVELDFRSSSVQETAERKFQQVFATFTKHFHPKLLLQSSAIVRGEIGIDGDARKFLATHVMNISENKHDQLDRPLHLLGIRVLCPPFKQVNPETKEEKSAEWSVNLRLESLIGDVGKLFLEAHADWFEVRPWSDTSAERVINHVDTVKEYLNSSVLRFLMPNEPNDYPEGEYRGGD